MGCISSPNLNIPQYNFKTRNAALKIYELITIYRDQLLNKLDHSYFISCVLAALEGEGDPRNLILSFDLQKFILLNFLNSNSSIEKE